MNTHRQRPLSLDGLRAFEAVARRLSFSAAAEELYLTQSAVSRQIKSLEEEIGASLFNRGTRKVELTAAGAALEQAVSPSLERIDRTVRQLRIARGRQHVNVSTFASFATLWLMPRLAAFQALHPDIDIRLSASDKLVDMDDPEVDLLLRYDYPHNVPAHAEPMFGEMLSPMTSPWLVEQSRNGSAAPLRQAADLAGHALLEEDDHRPSAFSLSWRRWLQLHGEPQLEPRRWIYLNYTHQQVQGALAGQGIALARMPMVHELLARGELVEPFGPAGRLAGDASYWLILLPQARLRPALQAFADWVRSEAAHTRAAMAHEGQASQ
ncbi:LysR substrate-binding domain-containing protein [Aquabacterium sp.]|uniref:LysR substrate-binding domain-containing protein n=1 Tax=Aquabacterium sp. TaxID=1872578 RepID=UPI002CD9364F|nr:LysR substrate-binding domain-containing protein [Aquabacterium sp.]HSW08206.1 LysR substrate-binding domain-containing protein [Aquabacterium sp.]